MALDEYLSLPLVGAAVTLLLTWWILQFLNKTRKLPPGPWGLPFFGYYPFISPTPAKDLTELSQKYGNIYSFRTLGGRLIIVLNGSKTIKDVLVNRADEFLGRPFGNSLVSWVSKGIGMTQEEGEPWREQRKFFLQSAKNFGFGKIELEPRIHEEIHGMIQDLRKTGGKDADVQFHISYANNSIISHVLFSKKFTKDEFYRNLVKSFEDLVKLFVGKRHILVGTMLDLDLMLSRVLRKARKARDNLRKLTDKLIEEHIKTFDPTHPRDYVDEYLLYRSQLLKNGSERTFTIERLQGNCLNFFMEGTESVSFTIAYLLTELSKHPEAQRKVQQELDLQVGRERLPSWAERSKLPYLEATIQELNRLSVPFQLSTMYSNFEETTIEGFTIPKRSTIIYNLGPVHFDPKNFPDPYRFDPSRFLDPDGKKLKRDGPYPFGIGKRTCIGESLGQMEVFLMIGSILQNFTVYPGDEEEKLKVVPRD